MKQQEPSGSGDCHRVGEDAHHKSGIVVLRIARLVELLRQNFAVLAGSIAPKEKFREETIGEGSFSLGSKYCVIKHTCLKMYMLHVSTMYIYRYAYIHMHTYII